MLVIADVNAVHAIPPVDSGRKSFLKIFRAEGGAVMDFAGTIGALLVGGGFLTVGSVGTGVGGVACFLGLG